MTAIEQEGTIIWLTGWGMSERYYEGISALLPEFQHISVDYYSEAASPQDLLANTERAVRCLRVSSDAPVLIGGWSLGGMLAIGLAASGLADGLILLSATAKFVRSKELMELGWADAYLKAMIVGIRKDRAEVERQFEEKMIAAGEGEAVRNEILSLRGNWPAGALAAGLGYLREADYIESLPYINCPALLIHGTEDIICPFAASQELLGLLKRAKLHTLAGRGHAPFAGEEAALSQSIRSWWHER